MSGLLDSLLGHLRLIYLLQHAEALPESEAAAPDRTAELQRQAHVAAAARRRCARSTCSRPRCATSATAPTRACRSRSLCITAARPATSAAPGALLARVERLEHALGSGGGAPAAAPAPRAATAASRPEAVEHAPSARRLPPPAEPAPPRPRRSATADRRPLRAAPRPARRPSRRLERGPRAAHAARRAACCRPRARRPSRARASSSRSPRRCSRARSATATSSQTRSPRRSPLRLEPRFVAVAQAAERDADRRRWHDFRGGAARAAAPPSRRNRGSRMSIDPQKMMKMAAQMQADMARAQEALAAERVEATAGGGMVKAIASGNGDLVGIEIDPQAVDPDGGRAAAGHGARSGHRGLSPGRRAAAGAHGRDHRRARRARAAGLLGVLSPAVDSLVTQLARLPGVGQRTAQRLAFHLLRVPPRRRSRSRTRSAWSRSASASARSASTSAEERASAGSAPTHGAIAR